MRPRADHAAATRRLTAARPDPGPTAPHPGAQHAEAPRPAAPGHALSAVPRHPLSIVAAHRPQRTVTT